MIRNVSKSTNTSAELFDVIDLGRMRYHEAFERQKDLHAQVLDGAAPPTLLWVEHEPVITISRRDEAASHLIADRTVLEAGGIEVQPTDRGGDITYHGPGQLVAYPIFPLNPLGLNVRQYIKTLEQVIIDTLADFHIPGHRDDEAIGVWVDLPNPEPRTLNPPTAKIAAIGVRVRRWVTMHGLALNITTNLDHFDLIVPCGLTRPVTSMHQLLGDRCPSMDTVKQTMLTHIGRNFFGV